MKLIRLIFPSILLLLAVTAAEDCKMDQDYFAKTCDCPAYTKTINL